MGVYNTQSKFLYQKEQLEWFESHLQQRMVTELVFIKITNIIQEKMETLSLYDIPIGLGKTNSRLDLMCNSLDVIGIEYLFVHHKALSF